MQSAEQPARQRARALAAGVAGLVTLATVIAGSFFAGLQYQAMRPDLSVQSVRTGRYQKTILRTRRCSLFVQVIANSEMFLVNSGAQTASLIGLRYDDGRRPDGGQNIGERVEPDLTYRMMDFPIDVPAGATDLYPSIDLLFKEGDLDALVQPVTPVSTWTFEFSNGEKRTLQQPWSVEPWECSF